MERTDDCARRHVSFYTGERAGRNGSHGARTDHGTTTHAGARSGARRSPHVEYADVPRIVPLGISPDDAPGIARLVVAPITSHAVEHAQHAAFLAAARCDKAATRLAEDAAALARELQALAGVLAATGSEGAGYGGK